MECDEKSDLAFVDIRQTSPRCRHTANSTTHWRHYVKPRRHTQNRK